MSWKNLFLVITITIILASIFSVNLGNLETFLQKTGYTSIVIQATVISPNTTSDTMQNDTTLTATVSQPQDKPETQLSQPPQKEPEPQVTSPSQTTVYSTVEPQQEKKEYINQTILLNLINQTENLKNKLDKLRTSSRGVLDYYSSINDTKNADKWINIVVQFNQALDGLEKIQAYVENVKDSATNEDVTVIKGMIGDVLKTLDKIVKLIKS